MTATHCPYCALQCGMTLVAESSGLVVSPRAMPSAGAATEQLCQKGWTSAALLTSPERLSTPLIRDSRGGSLREATWEEALARVGQGLTAVQRSYGRDAVGVFGGGGLTNEQAYLLGKLARVALRTANIDYNGRFCMSSAAAAGLRAFGIDRGLPFPLSDLAETDAVLLVGSNLADTMPPAMAHLDALLARGGALIVIDPRRTPTAAVATVHLQNLPGSDLALALGLLHLVAARGHLDTDYLQTRTVGWAEVSPLLAAYWPERVERMTGVPAAELGRVVALLAAAPTAMVLTARGAEQQSKGTDTASAFINLALALGLPGRARSGWGCLTGQGNGQGGREHGQKADQLPGYRAITDPLARAHVAGVWGVDPDSIPGPGRSATELLDACGTEVRALLVMASNVLVSAPDAGTVARRLAGLDFLVVADVVLSETAAIADVVLPVAQWAEETGTMTNLEGRVILRRTAIDPPPEVRTDLAVISGIADAVGVSAGFPTDPEEVFDELRRASAGGKADYAGISYQRIDAEDGICWPCPSIDHPGTPRLFADRFDHPDGRARLWPVEHRPAAEEPDVDYPYYLTTGRVRAQYQSGAQTRRVPALAAVEPGGYAELHPHLAETLGVVDGDSVLLETRRGQVTLPARITAAIGAETVFVPFHWGEANRLTNNALDPTSRMPEFKVCAVRVAKATVPNAVLA